MGHDHEILRPKPDERGLCARCRHRIDQATKRGSVFLRCARAEVDANFLRYPPLPVLECVGYEPGGREPEVGSGIE